MASESAAFDFSALVTPIRQRIVPTASAQLEMAPDIRASALSYSHSSLTYPQIRESLTPELRNLVADSGQSVNLEITDCDFLANTQRRRSCLSWRKRTPLFP